MTRRTVWLPWIALLALSGVAAGEKKVTVCHVPPGNTGNRQTISVGEAAVRAHLAHGDQVGACATVCQSSCDDGNDCTSADACAGTECKGTAVAGCCASDSDCGDSDPCTVDSCASGSCTNTAKNCAVADKCLAGFCNAEGECATTAVSCDDSNVCTDNVCDPAIGCSNPPTSNPPEPTEVSCSDTADNDCDGLIDSADPNCFRCGDRVVQPPEQCDDGNDNPFDGCDRCILVDATPD